MGCGPVNDQHMFGGAPKVDKTYHRFFGEKGGFLAVTVVGGKAKAEWMSADVKGNSGKPEIRHTELLGSKWVLWLDGKKQFPSAVSIDVAWNIITVSDLCDRDFFVCRAGNDTVALEH